MRDPRSANDQQAADKVRRRRSVAIALTLGFMVLAFYAATFVRLGGALSGNPL